MGLRSPQEMQQVQLRPEGSTRFQGAKAPTISTEFVNTLASAVSAREKIRQQAEEDQRKFVITDAKTKAERLRMQAEAELQDEPGLNSLKASNEKRKWLEDGVNKITDGVSERYKPYVQQELSQSVLRYDGFSLDYTHGQVRKIKEEAFKTNVANEMNFAIETSGSQEELDKGLEQVTFAITEQASRKYGTNPNLEVMPGFTAKELIDNEVKTGLSQTILGAIQQQSKVNRLDLAAQTLASKDEKLLPTDRIKAINAIKAAQSDQNSRNAIVLAEQAWDRFGENPVAREEFIRGAAASVADYNQAIGADRIRQSAVKKQKDQDTLKAVGDLNDRVLKGEQITQDMLLGIPSEKRGEAIRDAQTLANGLPITSDSKTFMMLDDMIRENPEQFTSVRLSGYRAKLNKNDYRNFESAQRRLNTRGANGQLASNTTDRAVQDVSRDFGNQLGYADTNPEMAKIRSNVRAEYERIIDQNPKITIREMKKQITSALNERGTKTTTKSTWFGFGKGKESKEVSDTLAPKNPDAAHISWTESIVKKLQSQGRQADPQTVRRVLEQLIKDGKDITRPR